MQNCLKQVLSATCGFKLSRGIWIFPGVAFCRRESSNISFFVLDKLKCVISTPLLWEITKLRSDGRTDEQTGQQMNSTFICIKSPRRRLKIKLFLYHKISSPFMISNAMESWTSSFKFCGSWYSWCILCWFSR